MSDRIAEHLLEQVQSLGYHVSVFELRSSLLGVSSGVELHTVDDSGDVPRVSQSAKPRAMTCDPT